MKSQKNYMLTRNILFLIFIFFLSAESLADGLLKIYYLRHAEGGHNVVHKWKRKPKQEWPKYVGNPDMFTPEGKKQIAELTGKLEKMHFDFIAVSPLWRTRNTILPYLKVKNLQAEIWPELTETKSIVDLIASRKDLPPPGPALFEGKKKIIIPEDEKSHFIIRDDGKYALKFSHKNKAQSAADAVAAAEKTIKMLKSRFSKSGKSILLVGHSHAGAALAALLTGTKVSRLKNTSLWMAEEQQDGAFKLKMLNNKTL